MTNLFDHDQPPEHRSDNENAAVAPELFRGATVVQLVTDDPLDAGAAVVPLHQADVRLEAGVLRAGEPPMEWIWELDQLTRVVHGADAPWTILVVPEIDDFGIAVDDDDVGRFRAELRRGAPRARIDEQAAPDASPDPSPDSSVSTPPSGDPPPAVTTSIGPPTAPADPQPAPAVVWAAPTTAGLVGAEPIEGESPPTTDGPASVPSGGRRRWGRHTIDRIEDVAGPVALTGIDARNISAWFGTHMVLDRVSLTMHAGEVTALIGPSGCGKSTFLRILNRMHEMIPSASMAGQVLVGDHDVYDANRKLTDARREIGMVFQKPNPFPAMSIYDNVLASLRVTGTRTTTNVKDELVESCLSKAGLWNEVKDRLRQPGGGLSGGQQQRLCIARALAIRPRVLLMDEPCSALDPTSTRRIEETIRELVSEVTIVIVTHNMQQAARVSNRCAFFLAEQGTPGVIVEHGPTSVMFDSPRDPRTFDYVNGRFG